MSMRRLDIVLDDEWAAGEWPTFIDEEQAWKELLLHDDERKV